MSVNGIPHGRTASVCVVAEFEASSQVLAHEGVVGVQQHLLGIALDRLSAFKGQGRGVGGGWKAWLTSSGVMLLTSLGRYLFFSLSP